MERIGDLLHIVGRQAEHDLKKFKEFIEHKGQAAGERPSSVPGAAESTAATAGAPAAGASPVYDRFAHPFDQTNGLVDLEGESDETADGENYSAAERKHEQDRNKGYLPPMGGGLGQH